MSARLAEALAKVADLQAQLGEAYTELSALYDVESSKGGKQGDNGAAGKVSGPGNKAAVGSKGKAAGKVTPDDDDDLPEPTAPSGKKAGGKKAGGKAATKLTEDDVRNAAKKVIEKCGKDKAVEILNEFGGNRVADVDEENYAECVAKLEAALEDEDEDI
jgi:hypothetical protein